MPKSYANIIKAVQGEDIPISVPVYEYGILADDIVSATFSYFGGSMDTPVEDTAVVEQSSVVTYVLASTDTADLDAGLYNYQVEVTTSDPLVSVVLSGFLIIQEDIYATVPAT